MKTSAMVTPPWEGSPRMPHGRSGTKRSVPKLGGVVAPSHAQKRPKSAKLLFSTRSKPQPTWADFTYSVETCALRYITQMSDFSCSHPRGVQEKARCRKRAGADVRSCAPSGRSFIMVSEPCDIG